MEKRNTSRQLKTKHKLLQSQPIQLRSGIFQRDSCSPFVLCTEIFTFKQERIKSNCGYQVHGVRGK
jgi:hypothetical protein